MPKHVRYYTVTGSGEFPVDMLRYDCSYPQRESDSHAIAMSGLDAAGEGERTVQLRREFDTATDAKRWYPTEGRWESFTWRVTGAPTTYPEKYGA
jgi:hypothetical protein